MLQVESRMPHAYPRHLVNADAILEVFSKRGVDAILIGGMNFLIQHQSTALTYDVDLWVEDTEANLSKTAEALRELGARWGRDDASWGPIPEGFAWLRRQNIYCLTSAHGAIDIFREVRGLEGQWAACRARCADAKTATGIPFISLSDRDMISCQMALPEGERRIERVRYLEQRLP
jgi:hypothetical protein